MSKRAKKTPDLRKIVLMAGGAIILYLLLARAGDFTAVIQELQNGNYWWILLSIPCTVLTFFFGALAVIAVVPKRLRFSSVLLVQMAGGFLNSFTPAGSGGLAVNVIFLKKSGVPSAYGSAALALTVLAGVIINIIAALALASTGQAFTFTIKSLDKALDWLAILLVVSALLALTIVLWRFKGRLRLYAKQIKAGLKAIGRPRNVFLLFIGEWGVTFFFTLALYCCLRAFSPGITLGVTFEAYLVGTLAGSFIPTPGKLGSTEAALSGLLIVNGVAPDAAVAGVLAYRLVTFWLPAAPGFLAYQAAIRRHGPLA
jgi:uncharacterized membrane protein YbhN (UPF0104 family)